MHYTLDSEVHVKAILEKRFDNQKILSEPFETTDLGVLTQSPDTFYFGMLTLGSNAHKATLLDNDKEIIDIDTNSQIIEYFTSVVFYDADNNQINSNVKGRFRGYQMTLE